MVARLGTCYILIHQEALLDVIDVLMALLKDTGLLAAASKSTPAAATTSTSQPMKPPVATRRLSRDKRALSFGGLIHKQCTKILLYAMTKVTMC